MRQLRILCCAVLMAMVCATGSGAQRAAAADGKAPVKGGAEILSDTQGVDFQPYLGNVMSIIYKQWIHLMPDEAKPPQNKKGVTAIRFAINPDGTIASMRLDDSSTDDLLDRAAWGAITGAGKFAPLPAEFHGPNLELRIHFVVNQSKT